MSLLNFLLTPASIVLVTSTVFGADIKASPSPSPSPLRAAQVKPTQTATGYSHLLPSTQDIGSASEREKEAAHNKEVAKENKESAVRDSRWIQPSPNPGIGSKGKSSDSKVKLTVSCTDSAGTIFQPDDEGYSACTKQITVKGQNHDSPSPIGRIESNGSKPTVGAGFNVPLGK